MPYPRQRSKAWFVTRWPYRIFVLREFSAVFLAAYTVVLLLLVHKVHEGEHAFRNFENTLRSPGMLALNCVILLFALLHTATWFQAVPKALPLRRGEAKVPPQLLIGGHVLAMLTLSAVLIILALV
jgi:fumarate reductase subunit C